jgi:hypothetical protein
MTVTVEYGTVLTGSGPRKAVRKTTTDGTVTVEVFAVAKASKSRTSRRKATPTQAETFEAN